MRDSILTVEAVKKYFGGLRALQDVSFDVRRGSITAVIGPNGAGKSTLFNVITGAARPTGGRIVFKGRDTSRWPAHRIAAAGIGRTFQNIRLFPSLNVLENVMTGYMCRTHATLVESLLALPRDRRERRSMRERAEALLGDLGVHSRRLYMPSELPYGDQRRVEVARALATDPELLMLDEPAAGMTHEEAEDFMGIVTRLNEAGRTVLLIEHNMQLVMTISQHICVLNFGQKIAEGTPEQIRTDDAVLEAYLGREQ